MSLKRFSISLGQVDYDALKTDAALVAEAKRLAPKFLKIAAEKTAEEMWESVRKLGLSGTNKSQFVREKAAELMKDSEFKEMTLSHVTKTLREEKKKSEK